MKMILKKIKIVVVLMTFTGIVHASDTPLAQKKIAIHSIYMNGIVSGNGFGMQYVPSMGIRFGKRIIVSGGPIFNSTDWKRTGYEMGTAFLLVRESESNNGHMFLSANLSMQRFNGAALGASTVSYEKKIAQSAHKTELGDIETLRFSGWEYSAGFSMNYRFRCGLLLKSSAGFAFTDTYQVNSPEISISRENKIGSLQLSAGIGWTFGKMMNKQEHALKMMADYQEEELLYSQR